MQKVRLTNSFLLLLLVAACSLPFLNQAFHIDDRIYLQVAENIRDKPLYPYDFAALFEGFVAPDAASHSHLPLTSYYLAFLNWLGPSETEWFLHLGFLIFPFIAVLSFYSLCRHFVSFPGAAACLLATSPAFLTLSHTLMPDIPLLAFWLMALAGFLELTDGRAGGKDWGLCAVGLAGAAFLSLLTLGLVLLMAAYLTVKHWEVSRFHIDAEQNSADSQAESSGRYSVPIAGNDAAKRRGIRLPVVPMVGPKQIRGSRLSALLALLLLPILIWVLWYLRAYLHYDRLVLIDTALHMSLRSALTGGLLAEKGLSFVLNVGGVFLFPLALWYGFAGKILFRTALLFGYLSLIPFYLWIEEWDWPQIMLFGFLLASGLVVLCKLTSALLRTLCALYSSGDERRNLRPFWNALGGTGSASCAAIPPAHLLLLLFWFFGIVGACLLLFYSGSVRYTLLAGPPLILLWVKSLEFRIAERYFLRNLIWLSFFLNLPLSLLIAWGDYRFAETYPRAAAQITDRYRQSDTTIWYAGEWGFRYYMEKMGARPVTKVSAEPQAGDYIVKPYLAMPWITLLDGPEHVSLVEQIHAKPPSPIRILDFSSHAGWYSTGWGILPFSISRHNHWEWFNVYRVERPYQGPPVQPERPW